MITFGTSGRSVAGSKYWPMFRSRARRQGHLPKPPVAGRRAVTAARLNRNVGPNHELTRRLIRPTLYDMKTSTLTIRLDKDLNDLLTKASRRSGRNRSEVAREALRRQLRISQFEALRRKIMPFAEARGYLTDEDVFADVS